ncbi:uncharacterized protein K489DRAFT_250822 [Dissoconium aciculare CBS 342.82]|uniref:Uncharacterized protein n=1 Tax=Dissoconium aciculare CBS 342.82 TaxID=1314786 RepID=A0A6J3M0K3_9PEZI|nr:uncharacterized protein K489DRAFT_250822 [Dissoconium aciculare CBS 342.82]KAF1821560.1 hypothetical protein K489DRAFT_250822 [Dissoconium aciculare CBS 342.82]
MLQRKALVQNFSAHAAVASVFSFFQGSLAHMGSVRVPPGETHVRDRSHPDLFSPLPPILVHFWGDSPHAHNILEAINDEQYPSRACSCYWRASACWTRHPLYLSRTRVHDRVPHLTAGTAPHVSTGQIGRPRAEEQK